MISLEIVKGKKTSKKTIQTRKKTIPIEYGYLLKYFTMSLVQLVY